MADAAASDDAVSTDDPAAADDPPRLLVWTLAAFHAAFLVATGVTLLHLGGAVGDLLAGFRTEVGAVLYLLLWATTWWSARRWLAAARLTVDEGPPLETVLARAVVWGGATGVGFLVGLVVVVLLPLVLVADASATPALVALVVVGSVLAFAVGGVVGVALALVDLGCWRAAGWLLAPAPESRR